ncbi:MAG: hypothetical protein GX422_05410 [Deltaproteobacteria bacterium]|nr:hypothetical protein [Deltaproteobacteria bacterium]
MEKPVEGALRFFCLQGSPRPLAVAANRRGIASTWRRSGGKDCRYVVDRLEAAMKRQGGADAQHSTGRFAHRNKALHPAARPSVLRLAVRSTGDRGDQTRNR